MSGSYNGFFDYGGAVPFGTFRRLAPASPSPFEAGLGGAFYLNPSQGTYPGNPNSFIDSGSRGADLEGLYHYSTSKATYSKELNSAVDLGYHYPNYAADAAAGDYDRDMKPDLEEDLDGDGVADAQESSWLVFLDADLDGLEDGWEVQYFGSTATVDAEGDYDGDGLLNLAEFRLLKNPTVSDNPLNLAQVVNGSQIADQVFLFLPLLSQLGRPPIVLEVDSFPSPDAALNVNDAGQLGMFLETRHYLNGTRSLQLAFQYKSLPPSPGLPTHIRGAQKNVQFANQALFNPVASKFESLLVVDASLPNYTTADYTVSIYNDNSQQLAATTGSTTDGSITEAWSTVDQQGNPTVNGNVYAIITIYPPNGNPIQIAPKWYLQDRAALDGRYLIAWGWDTGSSQPHATRKAAVINKGSNWCSVVGLNHIVPVPVKRVAF